MDPTSSQQLPVRPGCWDFRVIVNGRITSTNGQLVIDAWKQHLHTTTSKVSEPLLGCSVDLVSPLPLPIWPLYRPLSP